MKSIQDVKDALQNSIFTQPVDLTFCPCLLKEGVDILAYPLFTIFTQSLITHQFSSPWKYANVSAIHKKDDKLSPISPLGRTR